MAPQVFKNMVFATAGPLDKLSDEQILLWARQRKGDFTKDFPDRVTHLLCSTEQFERRVPRGERYQLIK